MRVELNIQDLEYIKGPVLEQGLGGQLELSIRL
jgi:hypothetical protein